MGDLRNRVKAPPTRTYEQNRLLWALLTDISKQLRWPVDGEMQLLEPEDWKVILSAGLIRHQRIAKGIEGGFVMLGGRTSKMTKAQFSELVELIMAFGAEHDITWTHPANDEAIAA